MKRILVVDDEYDISLTIKVVLEENGFVVDSFNDASEAEFYYWSIRSRDT